MKSLNKDRFVRLLLFIYIYIYIYGFLYFSCDPTSQVFSLYQYFFKTASSKSQSMSVVNLEHFIISSDVAPTLRILIRQVCCLPLEQRRTLLWVLRALCLSIVERDVNVSYWKMFTANSFSRWYIVPITEILTETRPLSIATSDQDHSLILFYFNVLLSSRHDLCNCNQERKYIFYDIMTSKKKTKSSFPFTSSVVNIHDRRFIDFSMNSWRKLYYIS